MLPGEFESHGSKDFPEVADFWNSEENVWEGLKPLEETMPVHNHYMPLKDDVGLLYHKR